VKLKALHVPTLIGLLALAACAPAPAPTGTPADEAAIRAIGPAYTEAWNNGDTAALAAFSSEDYEAVGADGRVVKGRAGVEAEAKEGVAARAGLGLKLAVDTTILKWASANSAAIGGTWTIAGLPAGAGGDKGAWTAFVVKGTDGQWRMATGLVAQYVPPPPPPTMLPADKGKGK
jgi:uncharacterized protein (TIGR02246 family)